MPRLTSLSLVLRNAYPIVRRGSRSLDGSHPELPALSSLEVLRVAGAPCDVEDILDAVDSPSFHFIALSLTLPEHDTDGWTCCSFVLSARFPRSLRTVHAECKRSGAIVSSRSFKEYVRPLLPLHHIVDCSLAIEDSAGIAMTDADLQDIATSWPSLSRLEVRFRGAPAVTLPSISSLPVFPKFCPELKALHLPLAQNTRFLESVEPPAYAADVHPRSHSSGRLRSLCIVGVRFSGRESARVASFLRRYFPEVDLWPMVSAGVLTLG
ncbi:hypothetical protein C8T65DRAFT_802342 [Cerioporus squamosus]|nr:hypothetical protein C8T65DRAFT_802342 [Cerioporus squamosus]